MRRAGPEQPAATDHDHAVEQLEFGVAQRRKPHDDGEATRGQKATRVDDRPGLLGIEIPRHVLEHQGGRVLRQCQGDRQPSLHAATELVRPVVEDYRIKADRLQQRTHLLVQVVRTRPDSRVERDLIDEDLACGQVQREHVLGHEPDLGGIHRHAVQRHVAEGGAQSASGDAQHRGKPGSGRAKKPGHLPAQDRERQMIRQDAVAELEPDITKRERDRRRLRWPDIRRPNGRGLTGVERLGQRVAERFNRRRAPPGLKRDRPRHGTPNRRAGRQRVDHVLGPGAGSRRQVTPAQHEERRHAERTRRPQDRQSPRRGAPPGPCTGTCRDRHR